MAWVELENYAATLKLLLRRKDFGELKLRLLNPGRSIASLFTLSASYESMSVAEEIYNLPFTLG